MIFILEMIPANTPHYAGEAVGRVGRGPEWGEKEDRQPAI